MSPKHARAKLANDFRPIASSLNLFYEICPDMIFIRLAGPLEGAQPAEQRGFQHGRRIEEHLITAYYSQPCNRQLFASFSADISCQPRLVENF